MTPQPESPSWRDLESGFRTLAESNPADLPPMKANYDSECWTPWTFGFAAHVKTLTSFKRLCAQAAAKTGAGADHRILLNILKETEAYYAYGETRGYIDRVCEVAAEWCAEQAEKESQPERE